MSRFVARIKQNNSTGIIFMLVMMSMFQLWDGIMTHIFVNNGLVKEYNVLVSDLITNGQFLIMKMTCLVICAVVLWFLYKSFPRLVYATTTMIVIFYSAVLLWNFFVLFQTTF